MLSFKDYLLEGKLSQDNLKKLKDGIERWKIVRDWINDPKKEVEIDGIKTKIKFISKEHEEAFIRGEYKIGSRYQPLFQEIGNDKIVYRINDIDKTPEFGGGSGSGGGASNTKHTESAQCVYAQAYWDNKSTKFTNEDLIAAYAKVKVDAKLDDILNISSEWKLSCITGARILKQAVKGKSMTFHRGSTWVKSLGTKWKTLNKDAGFPFSDLNKWNPADIWLIGSDSEAEKLLSYKTLESLNARVHELFKSKTIYGVSLKLMKGATHVDTVNYRPEKKVPKYESKTIGKVNFYNSKDVYLKYVDGEIQFRGFGGRVDSWQGELGGAHAKLGKIGRGSINTVLKKPTVKKALGSNYKAIPDEAKLLKRIKDERADFIENDFFPLAKAEKVETKLATFQKKLKEKSAFWLKSKYLGLFLFNVIRKKEPLVTQSFITYASSQDDLSSAHLKLM